MPLYLVGTASDNAGDEDFPRLTTWCRRNGKSIRITQLPLMLAISCPRHIPKTVEGFPNAEIYVRNDPIHTLSKRWLSLWCRTANTSSYSAPMIESVSTLLKHTYDSRSHLRFTFLNTLTSLQTHGIKALHTLRLLHSSKTSVFLQFFRLSYVSVSL
jgi:hypothetical protein